MIATDPLDSLAAFYIADQESRDNENNMALKLNAHMARCLHGKRLDLTNPSCNWDADSNPLLSFQNHFNHFHSFTFNEVGRMLYT